MIPRNTIIACLCLALLSSIAHANISVDNGAIILSSYSTNPVIVAQLTTAEVHARRKEFGTAVDILHILLQEEHPDMYETMTPHGPLGLVIQATQTSYLSTMANHRDPLVLTQCYELITAYAPEAKGRNWYAYKMLLHRLIDYYHSVNDVPRLYDAHRALIDYDLYDSTRIFMLLDTQLQHHATPAIVTQTWARYEKYLPENKNKWFTRLRIQNYLGTLSFDEVDVFLSSYTPTTTEKLSRILTFCRHILDSTQIEDIHTYIRALETLALRLPADDTAIEMVAMILAERQKVQMLLSTFSSDDAP